VPDSQKSQDYEGLQKRRFLTKVHKSLASVVSFGRFSKTGISSQKVVDGKSHSQQPTVKRVVVGVASYLLYIPRVGAESAERGTPERQTQQ